MIEIKDLLARFSNLLLSEKIKKESIRDVISKEIGAEIDLKEIKIKNNTVYLDIKPIYKNEIFIKKEKIFSELNKTLGKKAPEDLR